MKNIVITPKQIKRELLIWLAAFVVAIALNIYAIIKYKTQWVELASQLGYVLALSVVFYLFALAVRLVFYTLKRLLKKKK
jgi:1,4-dihydroxy-2-naphthoate octaprenyltransferase